MSSSSVVSLSSFNLLFITQVLTVLTSTIKYNEYVTDKGKNISIPCFADGNIMWVKENGNNSTIIQAGRFLVLTNVSVEDESIYVCFASVMPQSNNTNSTDLLAEDITTTTTNIVVKDNNVTDAIRANVNNETLQSDVISSSLSTSLAATTSSSHGIVHTPLEVGEEDYTIIYSKHINDSSDTTLLQLDEEQEEFQAVLKINLRVRTPPGAVTQLYFKASTILGFLIWRFNKTNSGGYPVRSFTAEYRNVSYKHTPYNSTFEHKWIRMDPVNIAPNVRQMEVYHLAPNITYEFRIWANNQLGSGEIMTTNVTTLPETKEEENGWENIGIELVPNIILNPGFVDSDGLNQPYFRTIIFGEDIVSESESDHEPRMEKFKRKVSVFFMGPAVKRI